MSGFGFGLGFAPSAVAEVGPPPPVVPNITADNLAAAATGTASLTRTAAGAAPNITADNLAAAATGAASLTRVAAGAFDAFPSATVAYGFTLLFSSARASAVVRLRRSSDNAELDFLVDPALGRVTSAQIDAWRGASTDVFVVTLYDQSGNARHITQAATASQGAVYRSGAYITSDAGNLMLGLLVGHNYLATVSLGTVNTSSLACQLRVAATPALGALIGGFRTSANLATHSMSTNATTGALAATGRGRTATSTVVPAGSSQHVMSSRMSVVGGGLDTASVRVNANATVSSANGTASANLADTFRIGNTTLWAGSLGPIVLWPDAKNDADLLTINNILGAA